MLFGSCRMMRSSFGISAYRGRCRTPESRGRLLCSCSVSDKTGCVIGSSLLAHAISEGQFGAADPQAAAETPQKYLSRPEEVPESTGRHVQHGTVLYQLLHIIPYHIFCNSIQFI